MVSIVVDEVGIEFVDDAGRSTTSRRALSTTERELIDELSDRYTAALGFADPFEALYGIGRELYDLFNGSKDDLGRLLANATPPHILEVRGQSRPSSLEWAVLRAPFELLADAGGFLVANPLHRFTVVRRLGVAEGSDQLDRYRLGLAFMASSPRGQSELDYEAEESAILGAVGDADLWVEESGDPTQLQDQLNELEPGLPLVHLSCHGTNSASSADGESEPALAMEDEFGELRLTTAPELVQMLDQPRMVFLSACLTARSAESPSGPLMGPNHKESGASDAAAALAAHSFTTALVAAGVPAVVGWDGSVDDRAATAFARGLYGRLADKADLATAIGDARRDLLNSDDPVVKRDWHMARVWLGPKGGGRLVGGPKKRSLAPTTRGNKVFLDAKTHAVPVASPEMFVGRRPQIQRILRTLRDDDFVGVLIHGMGRLGKSSLATRVVSRAPHLVPVVIYGTYDRIAVTEALASALEAHKPAREMINERRDQVRDDQQAFRELLIDLFTGPCQHKHDDQPVLLVVDDLEQILEPDPDRDDGLHRFAGGHGQVMADVIDALRGTEGDSRLLITSRHPFHLEGREDRLDHLHLRPFTSKAQGKLRHRQAALLDNDSELVVRSGLWGRVVGVAGGNPGLLDLLGGRLVFGVGVPLGRVERVLGELEVWQSGGGVPGDEEARAFVENLTIDALLEEAGSASVGLLRALSVFGLPVPGVVVDALVGVFGGRLDRLLALGVADELEGVVDHRVVGFQVNRLARGRLEVLSGSERRGVLEVGLGVLFDAWGGATGARSWPAVVDQELTEHAVAVKDTRVLGVCAGNALRSLLDGGSAGGVLGLGDRVLEVFHEAGMVPPLFVYRQVIAAADRVGDGARVEELFDQAFKHHTNHTDTDTAAGTEEDVEAVLDQARLWAEYGNRLERVGEVDEALKVFTQARDDFTAAGSEREAAVAWGGIADVHYRRGEFDEVLRIRRQEELPVYERLGDTRSLAVAWGNIADVHYRRGEFDEVLRIRQQEELPVYERLGDTRELAITWGKIADVHHMRGDYDEVLRIRQQEQLPVYERIGDTRELAITWGKIADVHHMRGDYDEALRIRHQEQLPVYERIGDTPRTGHHLGQDR